MNSTTVLPRKKTEMPINEQTIRYALGGRLPLRERSTITGQQRALYDSMVDKYVPWADKAGFKMVTGDGRLIGPFNSFLLNPEITKALLAFDEALKNDCSFSERVLAMP